MLPFFLLSFFFSLQIALLQGSFFQAVTVIASIPKDSKFRDLLVVASQKFKSRNFPAFGKDFHSFRHSFIFYMCVYFIGEKIIRKNDKMYKAVKESFN